MADLPELPDSTKRKLTLQWSRLLDTHDLTGEHFHWHERERDRLRRIAAQSPGPGPDWRNERAADGLHLEADPAEQGTLSLVRELKAAGYTTRLVADELNRQECTTRRGTAWRFRYVAEALRAA